MFQCFKMLCFPLLSELPLLYGNPPYTPADSPTFFLLILLSSVLRPFLSCVFLTGQCLSYYTFSPLRTSKLLLICLHEYVYWCMHCSWEPEEGVRSFETEVTDGLGHHVGADSGTWVFCKSSDCHEPSPDPRTLF